MKTYKQHSSLRDQLARALLFLCLALPGGALAQTDDFNDDNDNGWTRYNPLQGPPSPNIVPMQYSLTNGTYRIFTTNASGNPANPGRGGSVREDVAYTDFYVTVDVVNFDPALDQAFGLLGRVREPGFTTTDGYALTYDHQGQDLDLTRFMNENPTGGGFGSGSVALEAGRSYRFVFIGKGPNFTGRVLQLPELTQLVEVVGAHTEFPSGYSGMVLYDNSGGMGRVDATFDNYLAQDVEPPRLSIEHGPFEGDILVTWAADIPTNFFLQGTTTLEPGFTWTNLPLANITEFEGKRIYNDNISTGPNKFYRLARP